MPNARVGAMPQRSQNNDHSRSGTRQQPSGITMEDLKKQTAMRLMAAQQYQEDFPIQSSHSTPDPYYSYSHFYDWGMCGYYSQSNNDASAVHTGINRVSQNEAVPFRKDRSPQTPVLHYEKGPGQEVISTTKNESTIAGSSTPAVSCLNENGEQGKIGLSSRKKCEDQSSTPQMPAKEKNNGKHEKRQNIFQKSRAEEAPQPPNAGHGRPHQKLPHGLTVQELKEMTKARLAAEAEAAERSEGRSTVCGQTQQTRQFKYSNAQGQQNQVYGQSQRSHRSNHSQKQHGLVVGHQSQQSSFSSTSDSSARNSESPSAVGSACSTGWPQRGRNGSADMITAEQRQLLYPHQQYESLGNLGSSRPPSRSGNQGVVQTPKKAVSQASWQSTEFSLQPPLSSFDALETASVNSHNSTVASDYRGSDSPFRTTPNQTISPYLASSSNSNSNSAVFGRSRSYPSGPFISSALESTSFETVVSPSSFTEAAQDDGKNGASPIWSVHDDRTIMRTLTMPLFESSSMDTKAEVDDSAFSRVSTPTERQRAYSAGMESTEGLSGLAKLAPIDGTGAETELRSEETSNQSVKPLQINAHHRGHSGHGEIPNWVAESVLVTPQRASRKMVVEKGDKECNSEETNKESVFRNADILPEGLGPFSPAALSEVPSLLSIGERGSKSWGGTTPEFSSQLGSSSFGGLGSLPEDFGSALNLHASTVAKCDPVINGCVDEPKFIEPHVFSPSESVSQDPMSVEGTSSKGEPLLPDDTVGGGVISESSSFSNFSMKNFFKSNRAESLKKEKAPGRKKKDSSPVG